MIKPVHPAALLLALSACWLPAQAQNVYRCGESYSNTPCAGAIVVPTDDRRSAAQRAQTDAATKRDARSAQVLETERLKREAKPVPAVILAPAPGGEPLQPVVDKPVSKGKAKKPEYFTAVSPKKPGEGAPKNKKKAAQA
jgi:hypothetical protein